MQRRTVHVSGRRHIREKAINVHEEVVFGKVIVEVRIGENTKSSENAQQNIYDPSLIQDRERRDSEILRSRYAAHSTRRDGKKLMVVVVLWNYVAGACIVAFLVCYYERSGLSFIGTAGGSKLSREVEGKTTQRHFGSSALMRV